MGPTPDPNQPNPLAPPINPLLMQAALNPPTSPSLGFQAWASDPQNAHKVVPAMTPPNAPLQPNAGGMRQQVAQTQANVNAAPSPEVAAPVSMPQAANPLVPPTQAPQVQSGAQAQLGADQAELQRLQQNGAGVNQVHNGFLRVLGKIGDAAGTILAPGVMAEVPGTTVHNWQLQRQQQGRVAQDQGNLQAAAQLADTQSQMQQRNAQAEKANAQVDANQPIMLTAEQAAAIGYPQLAGEEIQPKAYSALLTGKQKTSSAENIQAGKNDTQKTIQAGKNDTQKTIATSRDERIKSIADAKNKTAVLMQGMRDSTSRANTSDHIAAKGAPGAVGGKVPADVTKRAALASNVNENADAVDAILKRNPDIVGAAGGRYSNVQQMIGSDDPDIQELGVRMHNIALASNGAHGLRSAEAVAQTEHELFNNFKAGPQGIAGALKGTRQSVQTFLDDEKNFQTTGRRTGGNPMQPPASGGGKQLDANTAKQLLQEAGGDKNKARQLAKTRGYAF